MTLWKWRLDLAAAENQNTPANKNTLSDCLANNGSYATTTDEVKMFDRAVKLSTSGTLPVQARAISVPVKVDMRDCMTAFLDGLSSARWFGVRVSDGVLIATNSLSKLAVVGTPDWTRAKSLQAINDERNDNSQPPLQVIPDEGGV